MQELMDKTVLLLAPKYFGYEIEIKRELGNFGANVIYFDERPQNDFFSKVFIRLNTRFFIQKKIDQFYSSIIESTKSKKIDYLFMVNPETIDIDIIGKFKYFHPDIKAYTYMWDSVKNKKKSLTLLSISDKFFTFDSSDKDIDSKIRFLPLFYIKDFENISVNKNRFMYDLSFIGTLHSDRYNIIKKIEKQMKGRKYRTFFYFYSPSKILFFLQKLFIKNYRKVKWSDVSFHSLNRQDVVEVIEKSKVIVDIQHPLQTGLTMRTIEMLGAKRKLITTNQKASNYDFFNDNNIYIISRDNIYIDLDFFNKPYQHLDNNVYQKYSIRNWVKTIFDDKYEKFAILAKRV